MTRLLTLALTLALATATPPRLTAADPGEQVLIRATRPYTALVAKVTELGGRVTHQFRFVDGIAAEIPRASLPALRAYVGEPAITKDLIIQSPRTIDRARLKGGPALVDDGLSLVSRTVTPLGAAQVAGLATAHPQAYLVNNAISNVAALHAGGYLGAGVTVAVIDSGIRPGFPHISLDNSVVGCEDFVGDGLGCSDAANDGHGTFVAGMITANVIFAFSPASTFRNAILAECPSCLLDPPTNTLVPMIGTAPASAIYALRVFGPSGGAPTSRTLAAIERVIELRQLYDAGDTTSGRRIDVCNLSLGGATVFPGRDLFDQAADALLTHGIVPVISAANSGPATMTVGSPASAVNAIAVGAASVPLYERILRRIQLGGALGALYRPFDGIQMAYFSARGPDADGRTDPDVVSNGFGNFGQGFGATANSLSIASGTSFSAPSVAGIAAVLRQRFPAASAVQIRNAIVASANPSLLADGSTRFDQGAGYVDAGAAAAMLAAGSISGQLPALGAASHSVKINVEHGAGLDVQNGLVRKHLSNLRPGQRHDILFRVSPNTSRVVVALSGVTPSLPADQQNQLFGDDVLLAVHSAKTSAIGEGDYKVFEFTRDGTFAVNDPEEGIIRVSVNGDWTNAGPISADVTVAAVTDPLPGTTMQGKIGSGEAFAIPLTIPAGVALADFRLSWRENWGQLPANDLDMILIGPFGSVDFTGATTSAPEHAIVDAPDPGEWFVIVDGFDVPTPDKYELRVTLDGKVVR